MENVKYVCGKCRGNGLYREEDRSVGDCCIACKLCGNRYYDSIGRSGVGVAPRKVHFTPAPDQPPDPDHFETERSQNILTGHDRIRIATPKKKEGIMPKGKGICKNCGREKFLLAGLCSVCLKAARGLKGEVRETSLATIKERIENGDIKRGRPGGTKDPVPAASGKEDPATRPVETAPPKHDKPKTEGLMKNKLADLNNHLFAQLERLCDTDLKGDKLQTEIHRSQAITSVAKQIINNGTLVIHAHKAVSDGLIRDGHKMLGMICGGEEGGK